MNYFLNHLGILLSLDVDEALLVFCVLLLDSSNFLRLGALIKYKLLSNKYTCWREKRKKRNKCIKLAINNDIFNHDICVTTKE